MWKLLKSILGDESQPPPTPSSSGKKYTLRMGEVTKTDEVFDAWTSGELDNMLKALNAKTNLIDRHFLLMGIVDHTYKDRNDPKMREICKTVSGQHIQEFAQIAPALKKDMDGVLPRVTTFQKYATVLTEDKEFQKAIDVCETAISFGLHDGTKAGYAGRILRIRKKMAGKQS